MSSNLIASMSLKDEGDLMYTTVVGMVMAAIFATGFHDNVEKTLTDMTAEGTLSPFQSTPSVVTVACCIIGFSLGVVMWTLLGAIRWRLIKSLFTYRDWLVHPKSTKTKAWALCLKFLLPRKRYLNTFQSILPKYPLPKLADTCKRALEIYEPLMNEKEFQEFKKDMDEFESGEGPKLQAILEKRYQTEENWVSELWDNYAYLSQRTPILVNTSIGTQSPLRKPDMEMIPYIKQTGRAASILYGYLNFWELVIKNKLPALMVLDLIPICALRYRYLMSLTRVPGLEMDELRTYENSKHVIVIRKGVMYRVDVYCTTPSGEEQLLPAEDLQRQFEIIMEDTKALEENVRNPALFTAQNRTQWAKDRETLQHNKTNAASLKDVETAIIHIAMEESSPVTLTDESQVTFTSDGYNLWCDKSATIKVFENSRCGLHFEHATADATLFARMFEFVWDFAKFDDEGNAVSGGDGPVFRPKAVLPPQKLDWDLSQFEDVIPKYEEDLKKLCDNVDMIVVTTHHGKGAMKKCRVSPDGLMQMALQLAFYRMHKTTPKTYESATTRFFKRGRTETIRPVSKASVAFTKAMDNPSASEEERKKLLKEAISYQNQYKLLAMNGEACDRPLFGLYVAAKMAGVQPKIFQNKFLSMPDQLSTSQAPYFYDKEISKRTKIFPTGGGFGPQRPDGYGVSYLFVADQGMTIHISSFREDPTTDSTKFGDELLKAVEDIKILLNPNCNK